MQCPACQTQVDDSQRFCPNCGTVLRAGDAPPPDPMLGQLLGGKYKVVRLLGEGGMGAVYEGEQQLGTTKRKVAVKTLHPHLSRDPKVKARFEREVGTIAELEHPNTVQVHDFGETPEGILYIVMEFLQGRSLADVLDKEGALAPERALHILQQVCGSLEEAHGRGIVHRDLKPDNVVLVERAGQKDFVKVLDFGIAKRSREEDKDEQKLTQQGMVLGTPPYMSPEQFTGKPIDARSDIYSLAVMAYEMLTGKLPFHANTAWEWATQHMTQQPIPMESLAEGMRAPEPMRAANRRARAKSPDDRFQTVKEFIEAFAGHARVPALAGAAPAAGGSPPRAKTEVGAPLDVAAAFGPAPAPLGVAPGAPAAAPPMGGPGAQSYTPAGGNVAFTPVGIPQAPPRQTGGGSRRTMLLAAAGLIGVASVVAIGFAVKGSGGANPVQFDPSVPSAPPQTVLSGDPAAVDTGGAPADSSGGGSLPPLTGGGGGSSREHEPPHGNPSPPAPRPGAGPGPAPSPSPSPSPPKPTYDGIECQRARHLKALGLIQQAKMWARDCIAKGGNP
jgi:tRNA A-37 threonylcarbamoyl transferase component Bud32